MQQQATKQNAKSTTTMATICDDDGSDRVE
jgi:hypothetical protein